MFTKQSLSFRAMLGALVVAMLTCHAVLAASPALKSVMPRGGQRGTEVDLVLAGDRLADAKEMLFYAPGLTSKQLVAESANKVTVRLAIAADAALGEHTLRLCTATGISELRTFWVGALPIVDEKEPNSEFKQAQKVDLNTTVAGLIKTEDVDYFAVEAKKGDRLTAEVEGIRLGETMFDPCVAIYSSDQTELAASDDTALFRQDPIASIVAPADGKYVIELRESAYGGNDNSHYRLHVGTFPRPRIAYPAGGQAGTDLAATLIGDASGAYPQAVHLPSDANGNFAYVPEQNGKSAPSAIRMRVSPFPNVIEHEPNNEASSATTVDIPAPFALNGILDATQDADTFKLKAKKDQPLDLAVYARRLGSSLDPAIYIYDMKGTNLVGNDDKEGADSYIRFQPPEDGDYVLRIVDQLSQGGPDYVYRIEVTPVQPTLAMSIPLVAANSQDRQTISVPRNGRMATLLRATRSDFGGPVKINAASLPAGVSCADAIVSPDLDIVPIVFEAAADAPVAGKLCGLAAVSTDPNVKVQSAFTQVADLVVFGNQVAYYQARADQLAVAVTEEAAFKLKIVQPKVPLVQRGSMQLKVVAERKPGFTGPISLTMLFNPPGVGSGPATIPENASEITLPLNANGDAKIQKWGICVIGSADVNGPLWASTQLAELELAPPIINGKIEMAATEQGKPAQVLCTLEQNTPFDGPAKVQLVGLPANTSAIEKEITAKDDKIIFDVETSASSPVGQHKSLICNVTVMKDGEPITQTIAGGGVLRIDKPSPAPVAAATPPPVKAGPVSRLEKLRQEQTQRARQ